MNWEEAKALLVEEVGAPWSKGLLRETILAALQRVEEQDVWAVAQAQQLLDYIEREKRLRQRVEELEGNNRRLQQTLALHEGPHVTMTLERCEELERAEERVEELERENERLKGYMTPGQAEDAGMVLAEYRKRVAAQAEVRRLEGLIGEIARDALGEDAPLNRGLNSVQAVLRYFMPEERWTEELLEECIREREGR